MRIPTRPTTPARRSPAVSAPSATLTDNRPRSRRAVLAGLVGTGAGGLLLATCGAPSGAGSAGAVAGASGARAGASASGVLVQPVVPGTDLAVGHNRFAIGLLKVGQKGELPSLITDGEISLRFFHPIAPQATLKSQATPQFRYVNDRTKGLYVATVDFDEPGDWGVEVNGTTGGQPLAPARVQFSVKGRPDTPALGKAAPRSHNLTIHDVDDVRKIDSGATPNDMHDLTIAQAIEQHKPLVVLFASPGFCVTQTCAPQLGEVQKLEEKYRSEVNFIHVEVYKDQATRTPYETVVEWGLTSEPWTFLVDKDGNVAAKFEGPAPLDELEPALQQLL